MQLYALSQSDILENEVYYHIKLSSIKIMFKMHFFFSLPVFMSILRHHFFFFRKTGKETVN